MTIIGLIVYAAAISVLLAPAAWLLDYGLSRAGVPTRWGWLGALTMSLALPAAALLRGPEASVSNSGGERLAAVSTETVGPATQAVTRDAVATLGGVTDAFDRWSVELDRTVAYGNVLLPDGALVQRWVGVLWSVASLVLALIILSSVLRLARQTRGWPRETWLGRVVRVSPDLGPATLGWIQPQIVVPRRTTRLPPHDLELLLTHEEEHAHSRDPLVQGLGLIPLVMLPWNPLIWWQLRKLRDAVEIDCDRRVLRRGVMAPQYGELLVELGALGGRHVFAASPMGGSRSLLERRLEAMKRRRRSTAIPAAMATTAAAIALVIVACGAKPPSATATTDLDDLRIEMFFLATKIELFRLESGNLPDTLVTAGNPRRHLEGDPVAAVQGIDYALRRGAGYALLGSAGGVEVVYESSRDNPYTWVGLDAPAATGASWDTPVGGAPTRRARLLATAFAETLYRDRASLLGWPPELSERESLEGLHAILNTVDSADLAMTLDEITAASEELRRLRDRYSDDYPPIQALLREIDTGMRTIDETILDGIMERLRGLAELSSGVVAPASLGAQEITRTLALQRLEAMQLQQCRVQSEVYDLSSTMSPARALAVRSLQEMKDRMHAALVELERQMDQNADLRAASNLVRETRLEEKLLYSRGTVEQWHDGSENTMELGIHLDLAAVRLVLSPNATPIQCPA
jgi:beta-lactamase regulating signal transducer with metallopeptidase domain